MRALFLTASAVALSCSFAFAQTPPPPPEGAPAGEEAGTPPPSTGEAEPGEGRMERRGGPRHGMRGGGPRHEMRGPGWRAMRGVGPEFKVEIDKDGSVKVEAKCGPREETRVCADITMELLDRALGN